MKKPRFLSLTLGAIALLVAVILTTAARRSVSPPADDEVPTARAKRGDLELKVYANGELRASHSMT